MNLLKLPLAYLLLISLVAVPVAGQQRRRVPDKTPAKTPVAPAPAPTVTFDTLLSADSYKIYAEARGVGQLISSSAATDVLDPILKLGGPPGNFVDTVNWLKTHANQMMTSRMMVAAWPTLTDLPPALIAIEFSSSDEATKFESQLNGMLANVLPPVAPQSSPPSEEQTNQQQPATETKPEAPVPRYYLQRADSLVLVSPQPVQLKKLRPKGSKLLSEDPNFRTAYNRFSSEPVFVYVDIVAIQKESEERLKRQQEEWKKEQEAQKAAAEKSKAEAQQKGENPESDELTDEEKALLAEEMVPSASPEVPTEVAAKEPSDAEVLSLAVSGLRNSLMNGAPKIPHALGIGFSPDIESFDVRLLMIDAAGESSDPIPFFAGLKFGGPLTPASPAVLPADSELVLMLSLDFPEIYGRMAIMDVPESFLPTQDVSLSINDNRTPIAQPPALAAPLRTIERITKINVKDELLPLLGSEVAVSMPMTEFGLFGPPVRGPQPVPAKEEATPADGAQPASRTPFVVISLRDREGMRRMMPRILEGFAGKAVAALAQSERREDTELVSIANTFAYAFIGDFLVLSPDAAATRSIVDSYLKGETLAANIQFKNYTRWQPQQVQMQGYLSPAFAESYRTWANDASAPITDEARSFLNGISTNPQPITYSLSNDGLGALHELHVPKSLLVTAIAVGASASNPPETVKNERQAMSMLWSIAGAQRQYIEEKKAGYGSLEQLLAEEMISKKSMDATGYKFEVRLLPEGFEISAVPVEYGKTGKLSFLLTNEVYMIRGGDHGGAPASASDPQISY